jgi:hypothetical protein
MTVLITLTVAGADSGPFNLFSNLDGYTSAFATNVSKASLLAGYSSSVVPDYTTIVRVVSIGDCTNYIDIPLTSITTTTSTTTAAPTTTTTTTVAPTTTTTTSSPVIACVEYTVSTTSSSNQNYDYYDCFGVFIPDNSVGGVGGYDANTFCAQEGSVDLIGIDLTLVLNGPCPT